MENCASCNEEVDSDDLYYIDDGTGREVCKKCYYEDETGSVTLLPPEKVRPYTETEKEIIEKYNAIMSKRARDPRKRYVGRDRSNRLRMRGSEEDVTIIKQYDSIMQKSRFI